MNIYFYISSCFPPDFLAADLSKKLTVQHFNAHTERNSCNGAMKSAPCFLMAFVVWNCRLVQQHRAQ